MPQPERFPPAKVAFHVGLAAGVVPFFSAPALWAAAFWNRAQGGGDDQARWTRRLFGLAAFDTLVAAVFATVTLTGIVEVLQDAPATPRVGVLLEEGDRLVVRQVVQGSPADEAGLAPGDVLRTVDGEPIADRAGFAERLAADRATEVGLLRDGEPLTVEMTPRTDLDPPTVLPAEPGQCNELPKPSVPDPLGALPYAAFLLVVAGLWIHGRRHARQAVVWLPLVVVFVVGSVLGGLGGWLGCRVAGAGLRGQSMGLALGELALTALAVGWLFLARRRGHLVEAPPPNGGFSTVHAYLVGLYYAATWMIRVVVLSIPLVWASRELGVGEVSPLLTELLSGGARDSVQAAFVFVAAVVLAPVAEEVLFRGVVLPHLARGMGPWPAIAWTAILFGMLHVAHGVMLVGPLTLGVVLGWTRWRSGSLGAPILLHTSINGFAAVLSWSA